MPTAWLLGTKLIGSLRDIILSSVAKVDLRTWMTAGEVVDLTQEIVGDRGEPCCYIDFLADSGDSQRLVYQLARLLKQEQLTVTSWQDGKEVIERLPRGSLLVIGGDTAYPIATHRRLLERIRAPFKWAHDGLADAEKRALERRPVSLLAVPGNHDYYDGLRGFEALAHSPAVAAATALSRRIPPSEQPLRLPGYKPEQQASYFAVALPFGWRLWGLDIETHEIDDRQLAFFQYAARWMPGTGPQRAAKRGEPPPPPDRLILVSSRPGFVYQGESEHAKVIKPSLKRLGLTAAFADGGTLERERVRLDLSGDVHLYERYWGTDHASMPDDVDRIYEARAAGEDLRCDTSHYEAPERYRFAGERSSVRRRGNDRAPREEARGCANYASVVSGLGGAFHHPSQVRMGTTAPRASWPGAERSAREIGIRLVNPYEMFRAGAVGIVGLAISMACYFLVWSVNRERVNVLDVPFDLLSLSPGLGEAVCQLVLVWAMVGIVVAMVGLPIGAYYLGRWLARPIREMRTPTSWWLRFTRALTHSAVSWRTLRFFGANPRSTWLFLTTIASWGGTLVGWWWLGGCLGAVGDRVTRDSLVIVYVLITILVAGMGALGAFRAGQKSPFEPWPANIARRLCLFAFGAIIALLVIWTPYAWIRLICRNPFVGGLGLVVVLLTMLVHFGRWVFPRGLMARRIATWVGFVLLVGGAVLLPWCCAGMRHTTPPSQLHWLLMLGLVAVLGGYFACLWVGWYFCICLQWNAHGNEAGGAARVTDFGEFLRIKLTKDKAEVWAISVEEQLDPHPPWYARLFRRKATLAEPMPTARLIDHFTVAAPNAL
jgi:hypothetical protein